jgi:hypothetical protein
VACIVSKLLAGRTGVRIAVPISVAIRSKAWACGCSLAGTASSNPTGGLDVCVLYRTVKTKEQETSSLSPILIFGTHRRSFPTVKCPRRESDHSPHLVPR